MIKTVDPIIKDEEINSVIEVLISGHIARGKKVEEFESNWSDHFNVEHTIATSSGTSALHTALSVCGVEHGDEVIVPSFSFFSTASMISACNANPVFVDVYRDGCIVADNVARAITPRTAAVVAVNLFGKLARDIEQLESICNAYGIRLIVDSCQCPDPMGAKYGDISCFSLYATKNITTGEGGMITTNNKDLAVRSMAFIDHGQLEKYVHRSIGYNYRMTDIAAAIGVEQLKRLKSINKRRRDIAKIYGERIDVASLTKPDGINHVFHQYVIRYDERDKLAKFLREHEIETAIHYPRPIHLQPAYRKYYNDIYLPVATSISKEVLSLPCHPNLTDEDVEFVSDTINKFGEKS